MSSIPYRRDIDGLRAIAILLVVLGHCKFAAFEGGFIGVDIFFVISGYLITSIIISEIDRETFSFKNFYIRRIRRILPALLFMLFCVTIASLFILFPERLISYAEAQFATSTSWSNFFLWRFFGGYWRTYVQAFPLTHTWSLAVEEQFYFIWPLVLLLAYKYIPKKFHLTLILTSLAAMIGLSQYLITYPEFAFYMIPARAFELFMGAGLAIAVRKPLELKAGRINLGPLLSVIGLILIFIPATLYREKMAFPGINAFWPCLGSTLLLLPQKEHWCPVKKFLSSGPMVGIGKISYSFYLWHWPPLAFIAYAGYEVAEYRWEAITLSLIVSILSYRFVENPFRRSKKSFTTLFISLVLIPALLCGGFYYATKKYSGFPGRFSDELISSIVAVESTPYTFYPEAQLGKGSPTNTHVVNNRTVWGDEVPGPINALLIGDSHATAIRPFVEVISEGMGIKGVQIARDSTPYLRNVTFYDRDINKELVLRKDKSEMIDYWSRLIDDSEIKYVFIAAFYYSRIFKGNDAPQKMTYKGMKQSGDIVEDNKKSFALGLRDSIEYLVSRGKIPVVFKDVPYVKAMLSTNYVKNMAFGTSYPTEIPAAEVAERHGFEDSVIDNLKKEFPTMIVIDPKKILCPDYPEGKCLAVIEGLPMYCDDNHLNYYGSLKLVEAWIARYGNPLTPR